jgi:hypothetical protein
LPIAVLHLCIDLFDCLSYPSESLERLLNKRIGVDLFQEKLESLSKSDYYAKALREPQLKFSSSTEMILDYEFARLYKILEGSIARTLTARTSDNPAKSPDPSAVMLAQYGEIIQQQNQQLAAYQQQERQFLEERDFYQRKTAELEQSLQETRDQYSLLKSTSEQSSFTTIPTSQTMLFLSSRSQSRPWTADIM